jgi:hypothetical protein
MSDYSVRLINGIYEQKSIEEWERIDAEEEEERKLQEAFENKRLLLNKNNIKLTKDKKVE